MGSVRQPIVWRVLLSNWDQEKFQWICATNPAMKRLPQAKGSSHMVECPVKGDGAIFVYKNKVVMSGIVEQDGFLEGTDHQTHPCYTGGKGNDREFTWVQIHDLGLSLDTGHEGSFLGRDNGRG
jgi:hypothetical protein